MTIGSGQEGPPAHSKGVPTLQFTPAVKSRRTSQSGCRFHGEPHSGAPPLDSRNRADPGRAPRSAKTPFTPEKIRPEERPSFQRIAARIKRMAPSFPKQVHVWTDAGPLFVSREHGGAGPAHAWRALWNRIATLSPSLVAIDPVSAALHGVSLNESGPVRAFMRALAIEALAVQCGVLLVAHDTKAARNSSREGDNPGAGAVAGSATWFDAARGVMYMIRTNTARHLMAVKSNYGRAGWSIALHERANEAGEFAGFEVSNSTATGATPGTKVPGV